MSRYRASGLWPAAFLMGLLTLTRSPAAAAGDMELGRHLATECVTCHRGAAASKTIPNIFGMAAPTFVEVMNGYRSKQLSSAVMQTIAARLKDDEIDALAAYFAASQKP